MKKMNLSIRGGEAHQEQPNIELWLEDTGAGSVVLKCTDSAGGSKSLLTVYNDGSFKRWKFLSKPFGDTLQER